MDRRELLVLAGVGAAGLAAGALTAALGVQASSGAARLLSASFPDLSGRMRRLREWQGRVTLFNFWATWCVPCREEMPVLDAAIRRYGFSAVGIGIDSAAKIREFAANVVVRYELLVADISAVQLMKDLGNPTGGLPFSVVLDRRGRVARRKLGALSGRELEGMVAPLLR